MKNLLIHDLPEAKREIDEYQPVRDSCHKSASDIRHRIITIRGRQILLDRDLAELYGVSTKALNQAVKRNAKRFPDGYMFQLTREEVASVRSQIVTNTILPSDALRSQIVTSKRGGLRYCPYAFTEHGVVMLASVLKSATATEVSVRIVNAFVAMRRFILANAQLFQRIEGVEQRQVAMEGKVDEILNRLNAGETPAQGVFYDGELWDARTLVLKLIASAKRSLLLIDNWATVETVDLFAKKHKAVKVTIITSEHFQGWRAEPCYFRRRCEGVQQAVSKAGGPLQ